MRKLARNSLFGGFIGLLSLVAAANADEPTDTVRIAGAVYLGDIPTAVAEKFGTFKSRGIQAKVVYSASGKQSLAKLRSGEADFALMALTPFVLDRLADTDPDGPDDPVILASLVHSGELTQLLVRDDAGINRPADLGGKRVAVQCGTNTEFALWLFMQFHNIEARSIRKVCIDFGQTARALREGSVHAAVLPDPWTFEASAADSAEDALAMEEFDLRQIYTGTWVIVTSRHLVDEHLAQSSNVLAAYLDAIDLIEHQPDKALEAYNGREFVPHPVTREQWEALDFDVTLTWALISALRQQFEWARITGAENGDSPMEILSLIDPRPLYQLQPHRVDIPTRSPNGPAQ